MRTSNLNVNNTESDHANAIFYQFQDAVFSREHNYVKTLTKIIFDLLQWQEICKAVTAKKSCHRYFHLNNISQAFLPRSQWHYLKSITCHFLQSMRRHFSPVKVKPVSCLCDCACSVILCYQLSGLSQPVEAQVSHVFKLFPAKIWKFVRKCKKPLRFFRKSSVEGDELL